MAILIIDEKKVIAQPVAKGLLSVHLEGQEIGVVERVSRSEYRSTTGKVFPAQVSAIRDCVRFHEAKKFIH